MSSLMAGSVVLQSDCCKSGLSFSSIQNVTVDHCRWWHQRVCNDGDNPCKLPRVIVGTRRRWRCHAKISGWVMAWPSRPTLRHPECQAP